MGQRAFWRGVISDPDASPLLVKSWPAPRPPWLEEGDWPGAHLNHAGEVPQMCDELWSPRVPETGIVKP